MQVMCRTVAIRLFCAIVTSQAFAAEAAAATRYVAKAGSNAWNNACVSAATPCATIAWAVQVAQAGDTIQIGKGTFVEPNGVLVKKSLTINGSGSLFGTNVTTGLAGSVFVIANGATVTLSRMVVFRGKASQGGGIRNAGQLTVRSVVIRSNSGGGVYNVGHLALDGVSILSNSGAGLTALGPASAQVLVVRSRILRNRATASTQDVGRIGGVMHSGLGPLVIVRSAVAWNEDVGIASATSAPLVVQDSSIGGNSGAGMVRRGGSATLTNVTVASNQGYGLDVRFARVDVRNSIVAANSVDAWNTPGDNCSLTSGSVYTDHSLFGDSSCAPIGSGWGPGTTLMGVDPGLAPLGYNGGFTPIHQLLPGSPAIDTANPALCWATDQHGTPRPLDGDGDGLARCDMGSHEREAAALPGGRDRR